MEAQVSERYHPSADQVALAASLGESLASMLPLSRLQESDQENAATWKALADLGVFGITTPEHDGGCGLGVVEEALIALELGRRAVAPSVLATLGASVLGAADAAGQPRVAAAYRREDRVIFVEDTEATGLLVRDGSGARVFGLPRGSRSIDGRLWCARISEAQGLGEALAVADRVHALRLRLLDAAALAGLARAALEMAVAYAGLREQFGRPIGSFQAVKHHCANMALAARCASDQVSFAGVAMEGGRDDAALQVECALFVAGSAALESCGKNVQIHGGIGFSDEAAPHRLLKRTRVLLELAGGLEAALVRVERCPAAEGAARKE